MSILAELAISQDGKPGEDFVFIQIYTIHYTLDRKGVGLYYARQDHEADEVIYLPEYWEGAP